MSFYGSFGYVQIASDFRIVATLQEQFDNLLFPWSHLSKLIFHALHLTDAPRWPQVALRRLWGEAQILNSGLLCLFLRASARPLPHRPGY